MQITPVRHLALLTALLAAAGCGADSAPTAQANANSDITKTAAAQPDQTSETPDCCREDSAVDDDAPDEGGQAKVEHLEGGVTLPDVDLLNEQGQTVNFQRDVVAGKIAAISFVFTTCKGICPPMGANIAALHRELDGRYGDDVALVSVSVDPVIDTPQRLAAWRDKFRGGEGWTLLTGAKQDVDYLLKEMDVFTADKNDHTPFILIGDEAAGKWVRVHGLTAPDVLARIIGDLHTAKGDAADNAADTTAGDASESAAVETQAQRYFTDVELVNQHGETMRLYSDVLKGKVVVINSFFSTCKGSCPVMLSSFKKIQARYGGRLGKDLLLVSISVDPENDTPERLAAYAEQWDAQPGWHFLTGKQDNVDAALRKLGHYVEKKESHSNVFIIGNEATGLWKKARGLSAADTLFPLIDEVLNDQG